MASTKRQKVRFTGKRTGMEAIRVSGYGIVAKGETIEIDAEQADRWTEELPMRDGKTATDWTAVGGSFKESDEKIQEKEMKRREKVAEEYVPDVELAHGVDEENLTAEEDAESAEAKAE